MKQVGRRLLPSPWRVRRGDFTLDDAVEGPSWSDPDGSMSIASDRERNRFVIKFGDDARFDIRLSSFEIRFSSERDADTIDHFLADQILPRILAHEGRFVLHGAAVLTTHGAIGIVGPSGAGKSTLAASLHRRGFQLIGDDALILSPEESGGFVCQSVYPSLRLFPDSITALFEKPPEQEGVAHYTSKMRVLPDTLEGLEEVPLRALFLIDEAASNSRVSVRPADRRAACMTVLGQSFSLDPGEPRAAAERLAVASRIVQSVPTFELEYPRDYSCISDVHRALLQQLEIEGGGDGAANGL